MILAQNVGLSIEEKKKLIQFGNKFFKIVCSAV